MPMRRTIFAFLGGLAAATALEAAAWGAPVIENIRFGADAGRTRVVVESDQPLDYFVFSLAEQGARVVIDLEKADFRLDGRAIGAGQRVGAGEGLVAAYRYADFSPTRSRIVLDLAEPARVSRQFALEPNAASPRHRLVLDLAPTDAASFARAAGFPEARLERVSATPASVQGDTLVVVLDAGHGGRHPGATGYGGVVEKTVNLAIAQAVAERLEADGRYRVVMTREGDETVELHDRVRIARNAGADLFLSIHADSAPSGSSARGASVYTLDNQVERRSRTEILGEDPWLLDVDLNAQSTDVADILYKLMRRDTSNQSAAFAELLIPQLQDATPLLRNTHRSGNLFVLLAPDVPAVLLEAGFITNQRDAALLTSPEHRAKLADAIVDGINAYFERRERLYATR